jgi:hypothetical protein
MAFLMREGTGDAACLYTACADEDHCKAELLLLLERAPADARVLGVYDLDPAFTVERFMRSYKGERKEEFNRALAKVRLGGFKFKQVGIQRLVMGVDQPASSKEEEEQRLNDLKATVEFYIPDFTEGVKRLAETKKQGEESPSCCFTRTPSRPATTRTSTRCSAWRSSTPGSTGWGHDPRHQPRDVLTAHPPIPITNRPAPSTGAGRLFPGGGKMRRPLVRCVLRVLPGVGVLRERGEG